MGWEPRSVKNGVPKVLLLQSGVAELNVHTRNFLLQNGRLS